MRGKRESSIGVTSQLDSHVLPLTPALSRKGRGGSLLRKLTRRSALRAPPRRGAKVVPAPLAKPPPAAPAADDPHHPHERPCQRQRPAARARPQKRRDAEGVKRAAAGVAFFVPRESGGRPARVPVAALAAEDHEVVEKVRGVRPSRTGRRGTSPDSSTSRPAARPARRSPSPCTPPASPWGRAAQPVQREVAPHPQRTTATSSSSETSVRRLSGRRVIRRGL